MDRSAQKNRPRGLFSYRFGQPLLAGAIEREHLVHPGVLSGCELEHTRVVRIVHEIFDRVDSGIFCSFAGVAANGALKCRRTLGWCVLDVIAIL